MFPYQDTCIVLWFFLKTAARIRIDTSARIGRSSGGGGINTYSSIDGRKPARLRFEAVRLSRLHSDTSNGGGGSGGGGEEGESVPPSPTSYEGARRFSRLWVGSRRQPFRDGRGAPPPSSTDTRDKVKRAIFAKTFEMRAFHGSGLLVRLLHLTSATLPVWLVRPSRLLTTLRGGA